MPDSIGEKKRGDPILAVDYNDIVRALGRVGIQIGPGIIIGQSGSYRRPVSRQSSSVQTSVTWAKITASQGTQPPYLYSATEQRGDSPGVFVAKNIPLTWAGTLRNLAEIGPGGSGAAPIVDDSIVMVFQAEDGTWYMDRLNYRGTYG